MQEQLVQALRYKLQKRIRRLNSAEHHHFAPLLRIFFQFFDDSPLLTGVAETLMASVANEDVTGSVDRIINEEALFGTSEAESAAIGYVLLRRIADQPGAVNMLDIGLSYGASTEGSDILDTVRTVFLEPFYEYVDEHLDDEQAILYVLRRYKHRCEWFHAAGLRGGVFGDTQRGEKSLALDLYEYLHDQGIDFHVEPHSTSGIADFVADQVGRGRVIADTKLFWPENGKGKSYVIAGFHQAYIYACDYNEPFAYLVIYKMCSESLNFLVPATRATFPSLSVNNKTIFFVVVDICEHGASASKRGPMKGIDITEQELVQKVGANAIPESAQSAPIATDVTARE